MLVGFDSEYGYQSVRRLPNGRLHGDVSTMQPVCACLYFEDGRELRVTEHFKQLEAYFEDPNYTFVVHGAHAEYGFCRRVGVHFPALYRDTLMMAVLLLHASEFMVAGGVYRNAALAEITRRYAIPFISAGDKDAIRESIMKLDHVTTFGMDRVLEYCMADARAVVSLYPRLLAEVIRKCGGSVERNLLELYQPYSLLMAEASWKGLRFDQRLWDRLMAVAPVYRERLRTVLRQYNYEHDGVGIGGVAFGRMLVVTVHTPGSSEGAG